MINNDGIKVRIFDLKKGLIEYEHIKVIRIVSKDYNLLIMQDYLPIIGEIEGTVDIKNEEIEKAKEYLQKEHKAHPFESEHYIYSMHICFLEDDFEKANRILDRLFAIGPNEDDLLMFKFNNDLNLKYVEYSQELADINERVKAYLEKNFNYSF